MILTDFDGIKIFEADFTKFHTAFAQQELFTHFNDGLYDDNGDILKILHIIHNSFDQRLNDLIQKNGSFSLLEFFYLQLERSHKLKELKGNVGIGFYNNPIVWKQIYKYLIELLVKHCSDLVTKECGEDMCNEIVCLGEEVLNLTNLISEFRSGLTGNILLISGNNFGTAFYNYEGSAENATLTKMGEGMKRDNDLYHQKYNDRTRYDINLQIKYLNDVFNEEFGFSYEDYRDILSNFRDKDAVDKFPKNGVGTPYISVDDLVFHFERLTIFTSEQLKLIFDSWTLHQGNLQDRIIYKPNTEFRLYARFFTRFNIQGIAHYYWSPCVANEAWGGIIDNFMSGKIVSELMNDKLDDKVQEMCGVYTKNFEKYMSDKLLNLGLLGSNLKVSGKIFNKSDLSLPSDVGEIDWIGIDVEKNLLMVIDFKTNKLATISIQQNKEIQKFLVYEEKLRKKINRVVSNYDEIVTSINSKYNIKLIDPVVKGYFITESPTKFSYVGNSDIETYCYCSFLEDYKTL